MIDSAAIISIVAAAFFDSGGLKAGTPFETASTPVIAVQPLENAVKSRKSESESRIPTSGSAIATGSTLPVTTRQMPTPISSRVVAMKK